MSDVQKPVEETPAAAPAVETPAESAAATGAEAPQENAEAPATEEPTATPAVEAATEAAGEPAKEEAKEVTPASEGHLGYKGPGLVKGLRFAKRFFYFNDEAVEAKQLSLFHQNEKPAVANPIAAWASQTGKGLLFFAKRPEDKATPAGIFNLAEVSDISKEGSNEFLFKVGAHKHTFQAANAAERDSWVVAVEAKAAEAKAEKEAITSSEGYKAELEKLTKPAAVVTKKPAEAKEETAAEDAKPKEEKATPKSRSQSRKRTSIFGSLLGKKEETEEKKEEKAEDKKETTEENKAAEPAAEASAEPAAAAAAPDAAAAPATETAEATPAEDKKEEKKAKRASIFGNLFQKVASPSHEKTEKEATAPAEENGVASTAPQLENPVEGAAVKPIEPESVTAPTDEPAKDTAAPAEPTEAAASSAAKDKRRTSFFGGFSIKKDNEATDGETKAKSNKFGGIFRKPSKGVKLEKEEGATTESEAKDDKAAEAPAQETTAAATEANPAATEEAPKPAEATAAAENVTVPSGTAVQAAA